MNSCRAACPSRICRQYEERVDKYRGCQECQQQGKCYSVSQGGCVKCGNAYQRCEEQFGRPIPPEFNRCKAYD